MDKYNITKSFVESKLKELQSYQAYSIPEEITEELEVNKMGGVLKTVGTDPVERPYTPLVKQLIPDSGRIPLTLHLYPQERRYIKALADILYEYYGEPVFDYSNVGQEEFSRVDNGINFVKTMSPLITPNASKRRYENLLKYKTQKYKFKPDGKILNSAIDQVQKLMFNGNKPYADNLVAGSYKSPFEKQTSNVGGPFFANETKIHKSGLRFKEYTVKKTIEGIEKYGVQGLAVVPSLIIGRDQSSGLDIDISKIKSISDLHKVITDKKDILKPSKARVVGATPRVANNALAPVVHPITDYLRDNSPMFCGYLDRDSRAKLMQTAAKITDKLKLNSANVDYSSYDLTVPPELIIIGTVILLNNCVMSDTQKDTMGSMVSNFIYTPYISYDPSNDNIVVGKKEGGIPSGSILTNLLGSIINAVASMYAKMKMYGIKEVEEVNSKFAKLGAPCITVLGDDVGTGFRKYHDIEQFSAILKDDFNFDVSGDGNKTAYGVFFLQERHVGDKVLYPTARSVSKSLGVERPKGLNGTLGDLGFASKLNNMKDNSDLYHITAMLMSLDKTQLGKYNPDGILLNAKEFSRATAQESKKYNETPMESLYDGDPSKIDRFDINTGQPSKGFLEWYFGLLNDDRTSKYYLNFQNFG